MFKSRTKFLALMACLSVFLLCGTLAFCLQTQNFGSNVNIQYIAAKGPFNYKLNSTSTGFIVVGYNKNAGEYVLPSTWTQDGKTLPVTEIGDRAFENETEFGYLNLPDTITKIGDFAFYGSSIEQLNVPENVKIIGNGAFNNCEWLHQFYYDAIDASIPDDSAGIFDGVGGKSTPGGEVGLGVIIGDSVINLPLAIVSYVTTEPDVTSIIFGKNIASFTAKKSQNIKSLDEIDFHDYLGVDIANEYVWKNFATGYPDFGGDAMVNHLLKESNIYVLVDVVENCELDPDCAFYQLLNSGIIEEDVDDDIYDDGRLFRCYIFYGDY